MIQTTRHQDKGTFRLGILGALLAFTVLCGTVLAGTEEKKTTRPQDFNDRPRLLTMLEQDSITPVNISLSGGTSSTPLIVTDQAGQAYAIWVEGVGARGRNIYFNRTTNGVWGKPENTSEDINIGGSGPWPDLAIDTQGNPQYVVTAVSPYPNYEIYFKQYSDGVWRGSEDISHTEEEDAGGSACPTIAVNPTNNQSYAVWYDDIARPDIWQLFFNLRTGGNWGTSSQALPFSSSTYTPKLGVDGHGQAHLIWIRRGGGSSIVYYSTNTNPVDRNKWTSAVGVSGATYIDFCEPEIAVDNAGNVYVVWMQNVGSNYEIYFRKRMNGNWGAIENISKTSASSQFPKIAVDSNSGNAYVVWQERANNHWQVYFNACQNGQWAVRTALTNNLTESIHPAIAVDAQGEVHIVYSDNSGGAYNIWYLGSAEIGGYVLPPVNVRLQVARDGEPSKKVNILNWNRNGANDNTQVKNYRIYRKRASQGDNKYSLLATVNKETLRYEMRGLSTDYKYSYVLTTVDQEGQESSNSERVTEPLVYPPVDLIVTSKLDASQTKKINQLTWKKNPYNTNTITKYWIYRRNESNGGTTYNCFASVSGTTFSYEDKNLPTGSKYSYFVTSADQWGGECEASVSSYEDKAFHPLNVFLKTFVNDGLFFSEKVNVLQWEKNPLNTPIDINCYRVYRKENGTADTEYALVDTVDPGVFEYMDVKLSTDKKYTYFMTTLASDGYESKNSVPRPEQ